PPSPDPRGDAARQTRIVLLCSGRRNRLDCTPSPDDDRGRDAGRRGGIARARLEGGLPAAAPDARSVLLDYAADVSLRQLTQRSALAGRTLPWRGTRHPGAAETRGVDRSSASWCGGLVRLRSLARRTTRSARWRHVRPGGGGLRRRRGLRGLG